MGKQIQKGLQWDNLVWKATSAYNFFPTESSGNSPFFLMFGQAAAKHMLLAEESMKYIGDDQGILNLKLMQQLYHVVTYNLAKSRVARDGNSILKRKNFRPKELKLNGVVLVRDHTSKAFEVKATNQHIVDFYGNRVLVKDNYGKTTNVHRKDVKPIEMDIAMAEFYRREREKAMIRDAKHVIPVKQIPDLNWKFDKNIDQIKATKTTEAVESAEITKTTETVEVEESTPEMICTTEIPQETVEAVETRVILEPTEKTEVEESAPETICTIDSPQEIGEQQEKHPPHMTTSPGSTTNSCPTTTEIETTPAAEQATQIIPTTE